MAFLNHIHDLQANPSNRVGIGPAQASIRGHCICKPMETWLIPNSQQCIFASLGVHRYQLFFLLLDQEEDHFLFNARTSLDMNETLNFECYSLGVILLQLNQYLQNFNKIPF